MRRRRGAPRPLGRARARATARDRCLPLSRVFSSCRSSPPSIVARTCRGRHRPRSHHRPSGRLVTDLRGLPRTSAFGLPPPRALLGITPPPSSPSSPPMRCPGSGLRAPVSLVGLCVPLRRSVRSAGIATCRHPAGGSEPVFAVAAGHLAFQVLRRSHLRPYKGTRGRRIVAHRMGELAGRFRGVQVTRPCATSADAFRIGSG